MLYIIYDSFLCKDTNFKLLHKISKYYFLGPMYVGDPGRYFGLLGSRSHRAWHPVTLFLWSQIATASCFSVFIIQFRFKFLAKIGLDCFKSWNSLEDFSFFVSVDGFLMPFDDFICQCFRFQNLYPFTTRE